MIETHEAGERENTTKGNGEPVGNNRESLGKHCKQDRRGSWKSAEGAKVKRFTSFAIGGGRSRRFVLGADGDG